MSRTFPTRIGCSCSATIALVLAFAGVSFACVPPTVRFSPDSGAPGTDVAITGSARVEHEIVFRWNADDGPILARATPAGSKVTATFRVPDAEPGWYLVTAVQPGNFNNTLLARTAFQVAGAGGETPTAKPGALSGPGLAAPSSGSVLPFVLVLATVAVLGSAAVIALGRRRRLVPQTDLDHPNIDEPTTAGGMRCQS